MCKVSFFSKMYCKSSNFPWFNENLDKIQKRSFTLVVVGIIKKCANFPHLHKGESKFNYKMWIHKSEFINMIPIQIISNYNY